MSGKEGPMDSRPEESQSVAAGSVHPGMVLEAAFVDPAYQWPPPEGEGNNAIELQASMVLLEHAEHGGDDDDESVQTTESEREAMKMPPKPKALQDGEVVTTRFWWQCCKSRDEEILDLRDYDIARKRAVEARRQHYAKKKTKRGKTKRKPTKYARIPEGILVYRLDTATQTLKLLSEPHSKTDLDTLVQEMTIVKARPSTDRSRRGMVLTGSDGAEVTMVACEQRTSISWLEAIDLMLANPNRIGDDPSVATESREWGKNTLSGRELDHIEGQYLNLANYSNKLIRSGKDNNGKSKKKSNKGGAGGIYYDIRMSQTSPNINPEDQLEMEALESIAKRRAVIKDSWDFYRMICSLLRDRRKYDETFRKLQLDPVYPYLHSMTGLNDPGDMGYENVDKEVVQRDLDEYMQMTRTQVAQALVRQAEEAMPSLVEICKALAGSLGMEEVGVGPVKEVQAALRKAEKKYEGDLLKVTDYCRALLVVKDLPSLLALLELARDSFGPLIRRVKLSTLKPEVKAKAGGYRDCIINLELNDHICEIQVHIWPMWTICGVDGFRHYRHSLEYKTDSFLDPYDALDGLERQTLAELIVMAEEAVADVPLDSLEWFHEHHILDYFAEAGLFIKHGLYVWAEITLRHLIRLRTEAPEIGPDHHETMLLYKNLAEVLRKTGQNQEANEIKKRLKENDFKLKTEKDDADKSLWDSVVLAPSEAYEMLVDPNKKEREEEEKMRKEVKASKKAWRRIRKERFSFLDMDAKERNQSNVSVDEKKIDEGSVY